MIQLRSLVHSVAILTVALAGCRQPTRDLRTPNDAAASTTVPADGGGDAGGDAAVEFQSILDASIAEFLQFPIIKLTPTAAEAVKINQITANFASDPALAETDNLAIWPTDNCLFRYECLYNINIERARRGFGPAILLPQFSRFVPAPATPVVGNYRAYVGHNTILSARFSNGFLPNIPAVFNSDTLLKGRDIADVEIFLAVQRDDHTIFRGSVVDSDLSLDATTPAIKTHMWGDPRIPETFPGVFYDANLDIALLNCDKPIDAQVVSGKLGPYGVLAHDSTLSPSNALIGLTHDMIATPMSFWSLVLDAPNKRAAVTLHVVLSEAHGDAFADLLSRSSNLASLIKLMQVDSIFALPSGFLANLLKLTGRDVKGP